MKRGRDNVSQRDGYPDGYCCCKDAGKELLTRPMDVTGEYIGYLYNSLVGRDYLKRSNLNGYRLTSKGRETLLKFLQRNGTRTADTLRRL